MKELITALHIESPEGCENVSCPCCGSPTFEFYRGRQLAAALTLHHGKTLRWHNGLWEGNLPLRWSTVQYLSKLLKPYGQI